MKKTLILSLFMAVFFTACYDDYKSDYDYTTAYFAYQYPVRTVILDPTSESIEFKVGATYGGKYSYSGSSETVSFAIADTMITNNADYTALGITPMPASWYTLSNTSQIDIVDDTKGFVTVTIIKDSITSHSDAVTNTYAIPFMITAATTDYIHEVKNFSIVVVKYKNDLDGRYYVKGIDETLDASGVIDTSLTETYTDSSLVLNKFAFLSTVSENVLSVPRIGVQEGDDFMYKLQYNSDGTCALSADTASTVSVLNGTGTYASSDKTFICNYTYTLNGADHMVVDTLIYSNTEIVQESWYTENN